MKKHLSIIIGALLLFGCSYNVALTPSNTACERCIIKVGESKDVVESRLGPAIKITQNKDGTYTAVYASAYNSSKANRSFATQSSGANVSSGRPIHNGNSSIMIPNESNKLIVLYDNNLQVKHYHFTGEAH